MAQARAGLVPRAATSMPETSVIHGVAPCRPLYPPWGDPEYYGLDYYGSSPAVDQEVVPDEIDGIPKRSPDITYKPTAWDGCRASERLQSGTAEGQDVGKADGEPQQESEPRWLGDSDPEDEIPECRQCGEQVSEGEHSTQCRMWGVKAHKRGARAWCRRYCEVCRSCREGKERRTKTSEKEEELPDDATENQETVPNPMLPGEETPRDPRRDDREEPLHETSGKGESSEDAEAARRSHQGADLALLPMPGSILQGAEEPFRGAREQQQARQHQIGNSLGASHPKLSCPVPCELRHRDICILDCRWTRGHDEGVAHLCDPCWNWWQLPEDEAEPQQSASSGSQPHSSLPAEIDLPYCHRCDVVILAQVEVVAVCRRCFNVFHDWCLRLHYPHCRGPYRIPGAFAIPDPRCFCHSCRPWRTRVHYFWQMFIVFGWEFLVTLACRARVRDTI